jgi:UDPglucose 6-dehydrogenase
MQKVAVVGTGYVGLVAAACLADAGNDVIGADRDAAKVERLLQGEIPIHEPGLDEIVRRNVVAGRLRFTTDTALAVRESEIIFIAVGTPPDEDGSADLSHVLAVARAIGDSMNGEKVVVNKSTVPVGTAARVREAIESRTSFPAHVVSNPEFLKEGDAVRDFVQGERVVIGAESEFARAQMARLYEPYAAQGTQVIFMDVASAEITKYAANAMLATRISFMNMMSRLCDTVGGDVDMVARGIGSDKRIGPYFLRAGCGYGGSCFPKDVKALVRTMGEAGVDASILDAVEAINDTQKDWPRDRLIERFGVDWTGLEIAVWGLAFKPETDDMREAPSLVFIQDALARGARVRAHDPVAMPETRRVIGDVIDYAENPAAAAAGADVLVLITEWRQFRNQNMDQVRRDMNRPVLVDCRNFYDPAAMVASGFEYMSIGRPRLGRAGISVTWS